MMSLEVWKTEGECNNNFNKILATKLASSEHKCSDFRDQNFISSKAKHEMGGMYKSRRTERIFLFTWSLLCIPAIGKANIAMKLWGCDLLQQWIIKINIPPIIKTNHKLLYNSGKNITSYYKEQSMTIQAVQERGTTAAAILKAPTTLPLKCLTDKPVWVKQWPLTTEKLQPLEQLAEKK